MMNRIGVCTVAFKTLKIRQIAEMAAGAGAEGLEIWGQPPHVPYPLDQRACESIRTDAADAGLEIAAFGSYYKPGDDVAFNGIALDAENQVGLATLLGTAIIRIWAGTKNGEDTSADERGMVIDGIRKFADVAGDAGISVVLERHGNSLTHGWDAPEHVIEEVGRDNVSLNYQVTHPAAPDDLAARGAADYRRLLPISSHAHIQNHRRAESGLSRCYLDEGLVDYAGLGRAAAEAEYRGWFMIEFLPDDLEGEDTIGALRRDVDYLRGCLSDR